jgi:hypothetical protein
MRLLAVALLLVVGCSAGNSTSEEFLILLTGQNCPPCVEAKALLPGVRQYDATSLSDEELRWFGSEDRSEMTVPRLAVIRMTRNGRHVQNVYVGLDAIRAYAQGR